MGQPMASEFSWNYFGSNNLTGNFANGTFGVSTATQSYGIHLKSLSANNNLTGNAVRNNDNSGIFIDGSGGSVEKNTLTGNYAENNKVFGIRLNDTNDNSLIGNIVNNNGNPVTNTGIGISLTNGQRNNLTQNTANNNNQYGIYLLIQRK